MRYKLTISVPTILAITLFFFGVITVFYNYLVIVDGKFKISMAVSTLGAYTLGLFMLSAFVFMLLKRRIR